MTPVECTRQLESRTGRLWWYFPALHFFQKHAVLMEVSKNDKLVLALRRHQLWLRDQTLVVVTLREQVGGTDLEVLAQHDPFVRAFATMFLGVVMIMVSGGLLSAFLPASMTATDNHGWKSWALFAFNMPLAVVIMRKFGARLAGAPEPEIVDFLKLHLNAEGPVLVRPHESA